jgi:acyl-coenzyme A thioesterase PaaI-like protein
MPALQDQFATKSICFGCGPCNEQGLQIKSVVEGDLVIAHWKPQPHHHAFPGVLNGGIIGAILDCHSNWAAAWALRASDNPKGLPCTVTAEFAVKLRKPTPMDKTLTLTARCVKVDGKQATIHTDLTIGDTLYDSCDAVFVAVGPDHPAHHRW